MSTESLTVRLNPDIMPSGAKKRKAAKKRKENQYDHTNSSSSPTHPREGEDLKQHEDRESGVEENSSPTSQDHHNLITREEEEKIPIERELKIEELDREHVTALDPKECVMQRNGIGSKSPDSSPRASADNDSELMKDYVVTPTLVAPPFPEQKTTWKSCCGLFQLFSGSSA